jgi:diguanylate cyclase (GGDEF)-like protein
MDLRDLRRAAGRFGGVRAPRLWALGVLMALVVVVAGGSVFAIEHLQSSSNHAQRREESDLKLSRTVEQLGVLEWQALAHSRLSRENAVTASALIGALRRLARESAGYGDVPGARLVATADRYRMAARDGFAFLQAGDLRRAHEVDAHRTDPAADALTGLVGAAIAKAERVADERSRDAKRFTVLIAVIGGLLTLVLLWRVERVLDATRRAASLTKQVARLGQEASHDLLTGLPNRRQLLLDLERVVDAQRPVAFALIDLDGFKTYNDTFGHVQGDLLLERLGGKLAAAAAIGRGRGYRLGGDEFCALVPDDDQRPASLHAIRSALEERGDSFVVTASSGIVYLPAEASDPTDVLRLADTRMYQNKRGGRTSTVNQTTELARSVIAEHDRGRHQHAGGAADMAEAIGIHLGLDEDQLVDLRRVGELHDIGKVGVPRAILDHPGDLDAQEWQFIHQHTVIGERILASAPALAPIARLVRSTHERYDGTGYPDQLAGDDIPLISRIVFVCDSWDAMTKGWRPYGIQFTPGQARLELQNNAGTQFDPEIVECALSVIQHQQHRTSAGDRNRDTEVQAS